MGRAAALGVLALAAAIAAPAQADEQSEALLRDWVAWMDASPEWTASAGAVRSEGDTTIAENLLLNRSQPDISISVERLALDDLEADSDGGFATSSSDIAGAALSLKVPLPASAPTGGLAGSAAVEVKYEIPAAHIAGANVPGLQSLNFDVRHAMTSVAHAYSVLSQSEVGEISVPEFNVIQRQPHDAGEVLEARTSVLNMRIGPLQDGVIPRQDMGPITIASDTSDGEIRASIAQISADQIDFAAAAHAFDPAAYLNGKGDGIWRPAVSRVGYSDLQFSGPDGVTGRIGDVVFEGMDMRQAEKPFATAFDTLIDPEASEAQKSEQALDAVLGMYSALRLGTMRLNGMAFEAPKDKTSFSLASLTLSGVSSEKIDSFLLDALHLSAPGGFASLKSLELAGFVFPDVQALMQFAALENDVSPKKHEETLRAAFAALPRLSHFGISDAKAGQSEQDSVSLEAFSVDLQDWNDLFAEATDIRIEALEIPRSLLKLTSDAAELVDGLGFERFVLGFTLSDRWSESAGTDQATWRLSMADAGDLEFSYKLTGLSVDWLLRTTAQAGSTTGASAAALAMLSQIALQNATLKVTDGSLLDRAFAVAARKQNLSVDGPTYRKQMGSALPFLLSAAVPAELAKLLTPPLQAFLAGGESLIAEATPRQPVPVLTLIGAAQTDPMSLKDELNVSLHAE